MANDVESNFREKVMPTFLTEFENARVFSKNVDTQLLDGVFDASSGDSVAFKRNSDYLAIETADGDLTIETPSPIVVGNGFGRVQDYITVLIDYKQVDEALKLNQLSKLLAPAAKRLSTKLETNFASFMMKNTALMSGTVGTAVNDWGDIANASAVMESTGVPMDGGWCYAVNPFSKVALANQQRGLGAGGVAGNLVKNANDKATIDENFGGMKVMTATTQARYTSSAGADRAGTLSANPDVTYATAKDTMTQVLPVTAFQANLVVKAGEQVRITGRSRLNLSTRELVLDGTGTPLVWTATVTADVTLNGSGAGNITVTGPAIYESNGAFNTVDSAPVTGDVVTLLGAASATSQPNLFWHKQAFSIGSVALPKLNAQENTGTTEDGIRIKVTRGSDFLGNKNMVRFDILPAFAALNPFLAGQGYGTP